MRKLSKKIIFSKPKYICAYCGRTFIDKLPHKCNTGFRKHHFNFIEIPEIKDK